MDGARRAESLWATLDLLVGPDKKRTSKDILEDVDEWLDMVRARIADARSEAAGEGAAAAAAAGAVGEREGVGEMSAGGGLEASERGRGAAGRFGAAWGRRGRAGARAGSAAPQDRPRAPDASRRSALASAGPARSAESTAGLGPLSPGLAPAPAARMAAYFDERESEDGRGGHRVQFSRRASCASNKAKKNRKDPGDMTQMLICSFSHPHVMSRVERLMGSNVVRITDRKYMLELQRRIREDHIRSVRERIRAREVDELEREKKLILSGRMSLDEAPKELVDHPVFQISQFIKNVLLGGKIPWYLRAARNHVHPAALHQMASSVSHSTSSRQILTLSRSCLASEDGADRTLATPTTLAAASAAAPAASATASTSSRAASPRANSPRDRSPREDADGGAAEADGEEGGSGSEAPGQEGEVEDADAPEVLEPTESATEAQDGAVVVQVEEHEEGEDAEEGEEEDMSGMSACDFEEDFDRQADVERGYMFTQEDYDRIKFEAESVKKMWELETVEELYALAESIVKEMVAQGGAPAPAPTKAEDRTPSPARSTKSPPPGPG